VLTGLFETVGPAVILGVGSYFVISGRSHDLGSLMAFVAALKRLYSPAAGLAGVHLELLTSYAYFERVFRVLDADPLVKDAPDAIVLPRALGRIEFENVAFTFEDAEEHALRDISLVVEPGECIALVGPSGAGKSTLARLVPRLADPTSGRVRLDGHDLRRLELKSLRSHIAVVTQETYLFHASVQDNLRYARPDATLAEIEAACQAAQIHTLIAGLPEGYETLVGERGYRMSGGERQRLAIARALLKNPRILILDEATSNLDAVNEALVQSALELLLRGRTSLVIAHRLTTVRGADRIVVLEGGRITETGRFEALVAQGGLFSRLHQATSLHLEAR
jgi:ATP-binding cassette subfamily B protein